MEDMVKESRYINKDHLVIANSSQELQRILDSHTRSLPCDFVKSYVSHSDQNSSKGIRILWQMKDIPCDNVPFSIVSHHFLHCCYSIVPNANKKRVDANSSDATSLPDGFSKCEAKISIRKIRRYTEYSVLHNSSKRQKSATLNKLKKLLNQRDNEVIFEELYRVNLPLRQVHNHVFDGKKRLINFMISDRIRDLVDSGVTSATQVKEILEDYVRSNFAQDSVPPLLNDEAYYPSQKKIKDSIYNYSKRKFITQDGSSRVGTRSKRMKTMNNEENALTHSFQPHTLEAVVQAFCLDETETERADCLVQECTTLRFNIEQKLNRLSQLSSNIEDPSVLRELSDGIDGVINYIPKSTSSESISSVKSHLISPQQDVPIMIEANLPITTEEQISVNTTSNIMANKEPNVLSKIYSVRNNMYSVL